jgi:REP element-mobilizing transposase RayT
MASRGLSTHWIVKYSTSEQAANSPRELRNSIAIRKWELLALNVRTNHVHTVVTANRDPEIVLNAFKANATRELRERNLWPHDFSPWVRKGSKRKLWNERSVAMAIDYVLYGQGNDLPDFDG